VLLIVMLCAAADIDAMLLSGVGRSTRVCRVRRVRRVSRVSRVSSAPRLSVC
jgi:hypothetical protein